MSNALTPATRRSLFAEFAGAMPPAGAAAPRGRSESRDASRNRSSHSRTRLPPGARRGDLDGTAAEAIRKLQATFDALQEQRLEDRKGMAQLAANFNDLTNRMRSYETNQK